MNMKRKRGKTGVSVGGGAVGGENEGAKRQVAERVKEGVCIKKRVEKAEVQRRCCCPNNKGCASPCPVSVLSLPPSTPASYQGYAALHCPDCPANTPQNPPVEFPDHCIPVFVHS